MRPDGGPVTRSKSIQQQQVNGAKISRQNEKINYAKIQAKCVKDAEPLKITSIFFSSN
jgi:hypothetical protein